jgi:N-omega-hydroxy-L-arginine synthase
MLSTFSTGRTQSVEDLSNRASVLAPILWSQTEAYLGSIGWQRVAYEDVAARVGQDQDFPCVFSKNAFRKNLLKFIFVDDLHDEGLRHLAGGLKQYVELSRNWDGDLKTAYVLVVAFSHYAVAAKTVEEYHRNGWRILQGLHRIDPAPWPADVARDPASPAWSMCFNGMPIFCNMSSPAHQVRRSRNLGAHFKFIINPRERFDIVAGDTPAGRKARANIRNRIEKYDGLPHSRQLGGYGSSALEWCLFGIIEDIADRSERCPFHASSSGAEIDPSDRTGSDDQ